MAAAGNITGTDGRAGALTVFAMALIVMAVLVTFPALVPGGPNNMRTSEIVNGGAVAMLILSLALGVKLHRAIVPMAAAAGLSVVWIFMELRCRELGLGSQAGSMLLVRWIMSLASGYWLAVL